MYVPGFHPFAGARWNSLLPVSPAAMAVDDRIQRLAPLRQPARDDARLALGAPWMPTDMYTVSVGANWNVGSAIRFSRAEAFSDHDGG